MTLFGLFRKRKKPRADGVWLTNDEVREHFKNVGRFGNGRSALEAEMDRALRDGDLERFVASGGKLTDLRPFAGPEVSI
jgi:hypothetical protein